jgi:hypothetical protein
MVFTEEREKMRKTYHPDILENQKHAGYVENTLFQAIDDIEYYNIDTTSFFHAGYTVNQHETPKTEQSTKFMKTTIFTRWLYQKHHFSTPKMTRSSNMRPIRKHSHPFKRCFQTRRSHNKYQFTSTHVSGLEMPLKGRFREHSGNRARPPENCVRGR